MHGCPASVHAVSTRSSRKSVASRRTPRLACRPTSARARKGGPACGRIASYAWSVTRRREPLSTKLNHWPRFPRWWPEPCRIHRAAEAGGKQPFNPGTQNGLKSGRGCPTEPNYGLTPRTLGLSLEFRVCAVRKRVPARVYLAGNRLKAELRTGVAPAFLRL